MVKKPEKESGKENPSPESSRSSVPTTPLGSVKDATDEKVPDDQPEAPMASPPSSSASSPGGVLWLLALLAIVIGGGYASLPLWKPYVSGLLETAVNGPRVGDNTGRQQQTVMPKQGGEALKDIESERNALNAKMSALINRLGSLELQLDDVRKMIKATESPDSAVNTSKSLQQLSGRLTKIEKSNEAISEISKRLKTLETRDGDNRRQTVAQTKAQALVLAAGQLREILRTGSPYAAALQTLVRLGGGDPQIAKASADLQANAAVGVPTLKTLTVDYVDHVAPAITAAAPIAGGSFFEQTLNRLKSLIKIRRIDGTGKKADNGITSVDGLAEKAGQALHDGNLQGTVDILEGLQNSPPAVRDWIRRAQTRLAAERALATLNVYAVSLLAPAAE